MDRHLVEDCLRRTAKIIAARANKSVTVTCRGNEAAHCDSKGNIVLPSLPDPLTPEVERAFHGVLDHENGHALWSDFAPIAGFKRKHGQNGFFVLNVVEDLRIEAKLEKEFPGSRDNLAKAHADCLKKWEKGIQNVSPFAKIIGCLFSRGKKNWDTALYGPEANAVVDLVADLIVTAPRLRSTRAAADLAAKILARWKDAMPPEPKPENQEGEQGEPEDAKDQEGEDGEPEDGEGNGEENAESDSQDGEEDSSQQGGKEDAENGSGSDSKGEDGPEEGEGPENDSDGDSDPSTGDSEDHGEAESDSKPELDPGTAAALREFLESDPKDDMPSLAAHLQGAIEKACKANGGTAAPYRVYSREWDNVNVAEDGDPADFQTLLAEVRPLIAGLRQKLLAILKSKSASRWVADDNGSKLDRRRLHRLMLEVPSAPFAKKSESVNQNLAISLLVDLSGSMDGERLELAKQCAALLSETLAQVNLPFEILGFTTNTEHPGFVNAMGGDRRKVLQLGRDFARVIPNEFTVFKSAKDSYRAVRGRIATMTAREFTPLSEALVWAAKRALGIKGVSRRIVILLTDGQPSCGNPMGQLSLEAHLDRSIASIGEAGVEIVAVGIQAPYVETHFKQSIVVNALAELPKEFYGLLAKLLLRHVGAMAA